MQKGQTSAGGERSFSKPPPVPLSPITTNRMRLGTHDVNGVPLKDRLGSQRERSPSFGSTLPLSPSHLNAREAASNPSQNFHDCSMCFSAYIQSLNTVCGTACRLAQCLTQVGIKTEDGSAAEAKGGGLQMPQLVKEVADTWEGIARAVGVASTSVKTQMLFLLQEIQAKQNMESTDAARRQESLKMIRTMLSTFLNLHSQFSWVILDKFSGVLQLLNDDALSGSNVQAKTGPDVPTGQSGSPVPQNQHLSPQLLQQHQMALLQQVQLPYQQQMLQQVLRLNPNFASQDGAAAKNASGGSPMTYQASIPTLWTPSLGSSIDSFSSQNTGSMFAPGFNALSLIGVDCSNEAILRRWSMGCAAEEARQNRLSLSPYNLIGSRRWSVPETHESGSRAWATPAHSGAWDHRGHSPGSAFMRGRGMAKRSYGKEGARSPSHSRSVTPDETRRASFVSNEELHDIIELLSLPLVPKDENGMLTSSAFRPGWKQFHLPGAANDTPHHDRIPENENESSGGFSSSPSRTLSSPTINDTSLSPVHSDKDKNKDTSSSGSQSLQQNIWSSEAKPPTTCISRNQISTSLWPPTGNVPGVTLTECVGDSDRQDLPPWSDEGVCYSDGSGLACLDRGCINRASWPISPFTNLGIVDDLVSGSYPNDFQRDWGQRLPMTSFRRHSTDAPYVTEGSQSPLGSKTRSFENLSAKANEENFYPGCPGGPSARDDLFLPSLNLAFPMASPPDSSQYSLFTSSN